MIRILTSKYIARHVIYKPGNRKSEMDNFMLHGATNRTHSLNLENLKYLLLHLYGSHTVMFRLSQNSILHWNYNPQVATIQQTSHVTAHLGLTVERWEHQFKFTRSGPGTFNVISPFLSFFLFYYICMSAWKPWPTSDWIPCACPPSSTSPWIGLDWTPKTAHWTSQENQIPFWASFEPIESNSIPDKIGNGILWVGVHALCSFSEDPIAHLCC